MTGIYCIDDPAERLRLALAQCNREHRTSLIHMIRRRYGNEAADALKADLWREAEGRAA